jgi:hypothetical protein
MRDNQPDDATNLVVLDLDDLGIVGPLAPACSRAPRGLSTHRE